LGRRGSKLHKGSIAPGPNAGGDVDAEGHGTLIQPRLYQLVRTRAGIADRTFKVEFAEAGAETYGFTFG
jgi:hypothetical protein